MFFDMECHDIDELWDSYRSSPPSHITTLHQDILMNTKEEEWSNVLYAQNYNVVLRDRLMTDAALGGPRPIKCEHSYSLLVSSPPSPATPRGNPHTPNSGSSSDTDNSTTANTAASSDFVHLDHKPHELLRSKIDEMEDDYFSVTIPVSTVSNRGELSSSSLTSSVTLKSSSLVPEDSEDCPEIKDEPISEPPSPCTPCQLSCDIVDDKSTIKMVPSQSLHYANARLPHTSDSEEENEECSMGMEMEEDCNLVDERKETILHASRQRLPPTPPSSASSDSEGTASASCSPERRDSHTSTHLQNLKGLLAPSRLYVTTGTHTTRQPIHTPLISCQPKGSTGILILTEEEKRTLIAEGYPVPTKLPLSKQEEKSLKKIRRKIKNKISAQESRRKKKEYMDNLEKRVSILTTENLSYKDKLNILEDTNRELLKKVQHFQALLYQQRS